MRLWYCFLLILFVVGVVLVLLSQYYIFIVGENGLDCSMKILSTGTLFQKSSFLASMITELMKLIGCFSAFVHFWYGYAELCSLAILACFSNVPFIHLTYLPNQV